MTKRFCSTLSERQAKERARKAAWFRRRMLEPAFRQARALAAKRWRQANPGMSASAKR